MAFSSNEKELLRTVKGVGPKVIARLEELGFSGFEELAEADARDITKAISEELGASCWRNSPMARAAIEGAIRLAQEKSEGKGS
ncbi:Pathogenicity locus [Termitidicoccus mucosus]|uniref:Pathogenicity locus n=2 Tax=Termitidicoccus mucosus TaxID=1184151 RepID=A0A178IHP2_9BACT|nr:Pathogenicity locus [Opitutaceae bacterium TSB47]